MPDNPKVSVVLCTFNGEKRHLREQLDSILRQTYPLHEIIVQDDHSTDGTLAILHEYAARCPYIKVQTNQGAQGVNPNFFSAMRSASGDLIAISDQDDLWEATKIAEQVAAIGDKLLCACRSEPFVEGGVAVQFDRRLPNFNLIRALYASTAGHCMLIRRELLDKLPGDCVLYQRTCYDVILALTAAAYDSMVLIDRILVHQRRYAGATTFSDYDKRRVRSSSNALHIVLEGLRRYREVKPYMREHFSVRLDFLRRLSADTPIYADGLRVLEAESTKGLCALLRLTRLYVKYRHVVFYTYEKDPSALVRALLHPFMQVYNYSYLADKRK